MAARARRDLDAVEAAALDFILPVIDDGSPSPRELMLDMGVIGSVGELTTEETMRSISFATSG